MGKGAGVVYTLDISQKEIDILGEILKHYDLRIDSVEKKRSAYKVYTDRGSFCLKRVSHGYEKARKSWLISRHLKENGFDAIAEYYPTRDGKSVIKYRDAAFYLTFWIDGREASFSDKEEILLCARFLAEFHNTAKGFKTTRHVKLKSHIKKWIKSFKKHKEEIEDYRVIIDKLKLKSVFDYTFRDNINIFLKEAAHSMEILQQSRYEEICEFFEGYVCHDSFYYQNILIDENQKFYLVDLESCQYDIPASDLGKLLRRVLSKKRFRWDFDFCRKIIESYCCVRPLAKEEYELLLSILIFPHKFWKLGRKRYVKKKNWDEHKYLKKLRRLLRERTYKREFIYCFINFYNLELDYDPDIIEL